MKYKVMKATGSLPTDERVKKMNDQQWLWYYLNILEDERLEEEKWKARLDYIGWWINPELAKSVMNATNNKDIDYDYDEDYKQPSKESEFNHFNGIGMQMTEQMVKGDVIVSDGFEAELEAAMKDDKYGFTQLPGSHEAGNHTESQEDFLSRVIGAQSFYEEYNEKINQPNHNVDNNINNNKDTSNNMNTMGVDMSEEELRELGIDPSEIDYFEIPE